jgi:hypothetical protein
VRLFGSFLQEFTKPHAQPWPMRLNEKQKDSDNMEVIDEGKTLRVDSGLAFWVWEFEAGDSEDKKNTFVVDTVGQSKYISFDEIPKMISWLQGLEKFRR